MNKGGNIMKRISLLFGLLFFIILQSVAQNIVEKEGLYYLNNEAYTGNYTVKYDNGNPKIEMNLLNGYKNGEAKVYFETGGLNEIRSYKQNLMDGTWLTFNNKNIKVAEALYLDGKKHGKWYIWNDEGILLYELEYTEGEKTGIWKNFDKEGNVISERSYSSIPIPE